MCGTINKQGKSQAVTQWCNNSMDTGNSLPSLIAAFGDLAGFSHQYDTTEPQLCYRGMPVQTLHSPCPAYFIRSNTDQNNAHPVNSLNEFRISSQIQAVPDSFNKLNHTVISELIRDDKNVPWNPDTESVDEPLPVFSSYLFNQSCFSEYEPDISRPTPANHLNLNHHLTDLPAELAYPQDSRQVAVVESPNLLQATDGRPMNSTKIVANKSSRAEPHRERYQNNPAFAERRKKLCREGKTGGKTGHP